MFNRLKKKSRKKEAVQRPGILKSMSTLRNSRNSKYLTPGPGWFTYENNCRYSFYRYVRDSIPLIRNAVETWVRILNTPSRVIVSGSSSIQREAQMVIEELNKRIGSARGRNGIDGLLNIFFREVFTVGSFTGVIRLDKKLGGIENFLALDRDRILWKKEERWEPYYIKEDSTIEHIGKSSFFHYGYGADTKNPAGVSPISSISFINELDQRMLRDMGLSSHNAGNPRIHIKITAPEPYDNEDITSYTQRAESYFEETMSNFDKLDVADNIFSWDDVEIQIIGGGQSMGFTWKINREVLQEDIICGMGLYPWVVGKSHGTTKNWVEAQFNLLMQEADTIQMEGRALAEFIMNTELSLKGVKSKAFLEFSPNQDPYFLEKQKAREIQVRVIDQLVRRGYLTKEEGARVLGITITG